MRYCHLRVSFWTHPQLLIDAPTKAFLNDSRVRQKMIYWSILFLLFSLFVVHLIRLSRASFIREAIWPLITTVMDHGWQPVPIPTAKGWLVTQSHSHLKILITNAFRQTAKCSAGILVSKRSHRSSISSQEIVRPGRYHGRHFSRCGRRSLSFHTALVRRRRPLGPAVSLLSVRRSFFLVSKILPHTNRLTACRKFARKCVPGALNANEVVLFPYRKSKSRSVQRRRVKRLLPGRNPTVMTTTILIIADIQVNSHTVVDVEGRWSVIDQSIQDRRQFT